MIDDIAIVYMVAGMSSRFGGRPKQFAKVGVNVVVHRVPDGEVPDLALLLLVGSGVIINSFLMTLTANNPKIPDNHFSISVDYKS